MTLDEARAQLEVLTPREMQVMRMRCRGMQRDAIAAAMSISIKTVDAHVTNSVAKLQVTSYRACWLVGRAGLE